MSIRWSDTVPNAPSFAQLDLVTLKAAEQITGAITCAKIHCVPTHFLKGRTLPCTEADCPGCENKQPARWEGYVSLWTTKPSKHIILRLTPGAVKQIQDKVTSPFELRGVFLTIKRRGTKKEGRLAVDIHDVEKPLERLPPAPSVRENLWHIWGLDQATIAQEHPLFAARLRASFNEPSTNGHEQ